MKQPDLKNKCLQTMKTKNEILGTPAPKSEYDMPHKSNHNDIILIIAAVLFLGAIALVMP